MTSAAILSKVGSFGNTLCNNLQSANWHAPMPSSSTESVSSNEIHFGKADLFAPNMMPKPALIKKVNDDNNDTNFEHASCVHVVSARDNQIH